MAEMTLKFFNGNARQAESKLGWCRNAVTTGLGEYRTGITCLDNYQSRGRKKTEDKLSIYRMIFKVL